MVPIIFDLMDITVTESEAKPGSRKGRPNYDREFRRRLAGAACEPGASVAKLARDNGINANMLFTWRRRYRAQLQAETTSLIPVAVVHETPAQRLAMPPDGLYGIEADIRGQPAAERLRVRQEKSVPLLASIKSWMTDKLATLSKKSDLAKAIRYSLNQWDALALYCEQGRAEISNAPAENALRCVSLGRNNAQPEIMRSLHGTARHGRQCDAPCMNRWVAASYT